MNTAFWFLILLACPLMMMLMMRGMHGGHGGQPTDHGSAPDGRVLDKDQLAELEREVADLPATRDRSDGGGR